MDKKLEHIAESLEITEQAQCTEPDKKTSTDLTIEKDIKNPDSETQTKYRNLVLSGGSIKSISQIGAVKKLVDEKLIDLAKLKALAGTSAGSLIGLLIVLQFNIDEIWNFIYFLNMGNMVKPDILLFLRKCGVETGQIIYNLIEEILTKKTGIKHINFRQLHEITNIHFTVVGSCLTTKQAIYYDHVNTPNFKVSMAIRISIGIPGFFIPITFDNNKYIDGGVLNNYPMNLFEDRLDETIGILICDEFNTDYKYPEQYFMAVMNLFMYNYYEKTAKQYASNTIYINKSFDGVSMLSFNIDNNTKMDLYNCGIEAVEEFIILSHRNISN